MSDILASIRKIMAQDPASGGPAAVKPPANVVGGSPRPGVRVPEPDLPRGQDFREQAPREQAKPPAPAPARPAGPLSAPAPTAAPPPTPRPTAAATGPAPAPAPASVAPAPGPLAADEPVSLDEFLALAAPPKDVITTPIHPAAPAGPTVPTASNAPAAAGPGQGPSRTSLPPNGPGMSSPKADSPVPPNAPTSDPIQTPMQGKEAAPVPGRAAPPPPKMLGDLGSVVPGRIEGRIEETTRHLGELSASSNDRYSPVGAPVLGPTPTSLPRTEPAHVVPAAGPARPPEPEIPGADALRRLIAGVVPPSAFSASAPAPHADDIPTKAVMPAPARVPEEVNVAKSAGPAPAAPAARAVEPAPAARAVEPAPAARAVEPAPAAKAMEPAPVAKSAEVAAPVANAMEPKPAAKSTEPAPVAKAAEVAAPVRRPAEAASSAKPSEAAQAAKAAPNQPAPVPAPAATAAVPKPAAGPSPKSPPAAAIPVPTAVSSPAAAPPAGRTMDETVIELLRPLLRDWLDKNMPRLIEPALRAEIEALRSAIAKDRTD